MPNTNIVIWPAVIAAAAAPVTRPLLAVFNEMSLVMAIWGALGGFTYFIAIRAPFWSALRGSLLGGLLGLGLGAVSPAVVKSQFGIEVAAGAGVEVMVGLSYLIGLAQERILNFIVSGKDPK